MEVRDYTPETLASVTAAYNRAVAGAPCCWPVGEQAFAAALAKTTGEANSHKDVREKWTFVAVEGSSVVGFVDAAVGYPREDGAYVERGVIRFLWYDPGRRTAGHALLERAERHLRDRGQTRVQAFPQEYRLPCYYLHAAYLSDRLGHVAALLGANGYRRIRGEVFMDWPNFKPADAGPCDVPAEIRVAWKPGRGRLPNVKVTAHLDGREIGACSCESFGEVHSAAAAQDRCFTTWLGVDDAHQGRGLGKRLLLRALVEMRGAGYRHATISTARHNHRAFLLYTNLGFRVADWTYAYGRDLV